jgi:hypothetical protein
MAADRVASALAAFDFVEVVALIGSVARPLWREVPRFDPYRRLRLPIAHECKDVDLAAWVSRLDRLDELRRARIRATGELLAEAGVGVAVHQAEIFLFEPGTDRYLGRVCYYGRCPAEKRACSAKGCGREPFLKQMDGFTLWPHTLADGAILRLYDRGGGGIIARAIDLPSLVLDEEPPRREHQRQ